MPINDPNLLNIFITESREHIETIEQDFIELEKDITNRDPELLNRIFRAAHTVKGSAGFFGLSAIEALTHSMENLLSQLRDGILEPTAELLDVLLEAVDLLNVMLDDVDNSNNVKTDTVIEALERYLSGEIIDRGAPPKTEQKELAERIQSLLPEGFSFRLEERTIKTLPSDGFLYLLHYNIKKLEEVEGFNVMKLIAELSSTGTILEGVLTIPDTNIETELPQGDIFYSIIYATVMEPDLVKLATKLESEDIIKIDVESFLNGDIETSEGVEVISIQASKESVESKESKEQEVSSDAVAVTSVQGESERDQEDEIREEKSESQKESNRKDVAVENGQSKSSAHETIRIRVDILDKLMMLAGELVLVRNQQLMSRDSSDTSLSRAITQRLDVVTSDLQETIMRTRMQPIGSIFGKFNRIVRDIAKMLHKKIKVVTIGDDVELDKNILEALTDPLTHIIRNSCDHGIELPEERLKANKEAKGTITLMAYHEGGQINVHISDDGKGIDKEVVRKKLVDKGLKTAAEVAQMSDSELFSSIFMPGFSTASTVSNLSGRGVGMDVVKTAVEKLGGVINMESEKSEGTTILLRLPLTLAIIPSLIVEVGRNRFAIPQINLEEMVCLYDKEILEKIECVGSREVYRLRNTLLPMIHLDEVLAHREIFTDELKGEITERHRKMRREEYDRFLQVTSEGGVYHMALNFAVLKVGENRFGLIIDKVIGTEEIVVKPMHRAVKDLSIYSGATVLGDGKVALILDALGIARHAAIGLNQQKSETTDEAVNMENEKVESLLLFNNKGPEQFGVNMGNIKRIEKISMNSIENVGHREFMTIDGHSTRVFRLEDAVTVSPTTIDEEMFLLLPRNSTHHYGILMSQLVDIGEYTVSLETEHNYGKGIRGSSIIEDKMTLLVNPEEFAQCLEPDWYEEVV